MLAKISDSSFAVLEKNGVVQVFTGAVRKLSCLDELAQLGDEEGAEIVFLNPFSSIKERGFEARGDEPVLALVVSSKTSLDREEVIADLPDLEIELEEKVSPSIDDRSFAELVARVQEKEIEGGNIAQVILSRVFSGKLANFSESLLFSLYRRLLLQRGQYMTVCFCDRDSASEPFYLIGASPERHLEIDDQQTIMSPIAGTMRKGERESFSRRLEAFLQDGKEVFELFQVVDEELKMMAKVCPKGGVVRGPYLRDVGAVIHTEYKLIGERASEPIEALRSTLHAPTLVGGPIESAARVIAAYEKDSRRYYGGEIGVLQRNGNLDTSIVIRCAEIKPGGYFRVQAGAGVVRDSDPEDEAAETRAKAAGILNAFQSIPVEKFLEDSLDDKCAGLLSERNRFLSKFLIEDQSSISSEPELSRLKLTIIDNEDNFAYMLGHMVRHMGAKAEVIDVLEFSLENDSSDVLVIGPGPGDINDSNDPRMIKLRDLSRTLLKQKKPLFGVCLGHQAIAEALGFSVARQKYCTQGVQRQETAFQGQERLGFYNSFAPLPGDLKLGDIDFEVDSEGYLITLKGPHFISCQFHPESVLSENGYAILVKVLLQLSHLD